MRKPFKIIFLLVILAVPVGIYLFLRTFGTNQFDVPVYHGSGIANCGGASDMHTLDAWLPAEEKVAFRGFIRIVSFMTDSAASPAFASYMLNLTRAYDALMDYRPLQFITVIAPALDRSVAVSLWEQSRNRLMPQPERWHYFDPVNQIEYRELLSCGFGFDAVGLNPAYSIVLVDARGKIRGYYEGSSGEDADRLILESKILFDNIEGPGDGHN